MQAEQVHINAISSEQHTGSIVIDTLMPALATSEASDPFCPTFCCLARAAELAKLSPGQRMKRRNSEIISDVHAGCLKLHCRAGCGQRVWTCGDLFRSICAGPTETSLPCARCSSSVQTSTTYMIRLQRLMLTFCLS